VITDMGNAVAGQDRIIIIPNGRVYPIDRQDVPSERDGKLICIATDQDVKTASPDKLVPDVPFAFLIIEMSKEERAKEQPYQIIGDKAYRLWQPTDDLTPEKVKVWREKRRLRKLQVGEQVKVGQLLAVVNPALAIDELAAKVAKLEAAAADVKVSIKTRDEAEKRYNSADMTWRKNAISADDYRAAKLAWDRYIEEVFAKEAAVRQAQAEAKSALTALEMYEIRASVTGTVKQIYKNPLGEAIKTLDSLLSIQSPGMLRIEATVEVQVARALKVGMPAVIEAAHPEPPAAQLSGHRQEVTCVAVSKGPKPMIVSGSEDRTVRIWVQQDGHWSRRWEVQFNAAVRALACTGPAAAQNRALVGTADGSVHLLDLDDMKEAPRLMEKRHSKAVNCVAFSPDGALCASGDDDRRIYLWNTADGQLLAERREHRAQVTSLQFASPTLLVSAGQNDLPIAWDLTDPKNPKLARRFDRRGGAVTKLGVSPDGKHVLVDYGKELRRMSLERGQIEGVIANSNEALTFSDMALFSPDGLCVLTNGPGEGRLQLWRTPMTADARADELRQYIWMGGAATCGAFAPDSSFAVTGTKDNQVLVWAMPKTTVDATGHRTLEEPQLQARLTLVDESLDSTTRQVRVWAELPNPPGSWLTPGSTATMVIQKK
jgi:WD40 repeat protein